MVCIFITYTSASNTPTKIPSLQKLVGSPRLREGRGSLFGGTLSSVVGGSLELYVFFEENSCCYLAKEKHTLQPSVRNRKHMRKYLFSFSYKETIYSIRNTLKLYPKPSPKTQTQNPPQCPAAFMASISLLFAAKVSFIIVGASSQSMSISTHYS